MGIELIRFDMSEYMERHSISRLIGAPPGYVGFDQGGLLTDAIDQHPHAVLLLDEIEKAHPDLFNILLQVMDHGKLTDHNGKTVDFRNVILIMTTNAGASDLAKEAIGFGRESREGEDEDAIKRLFTPEFRNRLDATITFAGLTPEIVGRVVEKFVMQLEAQLADRNVTIELSSAAKEWLAERGYDRLYGARPLARVIQEHIKKPLAEELLFGKLVEGRRRQSDPEGQQAGLRDHRGGPPCPAEAGRRRRWRCGPGAGGRGLARPARRRSLKGRRVTPPALSIFDTVRHCGYTPVRRTSGRPSVRLTVRSRGHQRPPPCHRISWASSVREKRGRRCRPRRNTDRRSAVGCSTASSSPARRADRTRRQADAAIGVERIGRASSALVSRRSSTPAPPLAP